MNGVDDVGAGEGVRVPDAGLGSWRTWFGVGVVVLAHVMILRAMGRIWWCACGGMTPVGHRGEHNSQHLLDWYTPSHLLHGVIFFWVLGWLGGWVGRQWSIAVRLVVAVLIEVGWEILENTPLVIDRYRAATTAVGYYGDSAANSVSDVAACVVGFWLARRIGLVGSVAVFVGLELLTLVLIRDNLTLNVLMLVMPVEGIREWQGR